MFFSIKLVCSVGFILCDFGERKGGKNKYKSLVAGLTNFFLVYLSLL